MKSKISVIIPCFNAEKYIKNCLDSILKSNFKDLEIIVVDNNSTDVTKKILKKYQNNPRVKLVFRHQNRGPVQARKILQKPVSLSREGGP